MSDKIDSEVSTRGQAKAQAIQDLIKEKVKEFSNFGLKDNNLWEAFQDDFGHLNEKDFQAVPPTTLRYLRTFLRSHGVWVRWDRNVTLATSLANTLAEKVPTKWKQEEVLNSNEFFDSNVIIHLLTSNKDTRDQPLAVIQDQSSTPNVKSNLKQNKSLAPNKPSNRDNLKVYFNNVTNHLITSSKFRYPTIRHFGHPFLLWKISPQSLLQESLSAPESFLTDIELRRLHRRFGHPSISRLQSILERSGHEDINKAKLE